MCRTSGTDIGSLLEARDNHHLHDVSGAFTYPIFANWAWADGKSNYGDAGQLVAQLMGVATLLGFVSALSFVFNLFVDFFVGQRVDAKTEVEGVDIPEMGALCYPDFVFKPDASGSAAGD